MDAEIRGLWAELEANKVAAGVKYGGNRLKFTDEAIADFSGDAASPRLQFLGSSQTYFNYFVTASFGSEDGARIATLKKGDKVTFVCERASESLLGEGYSLEGCKLDGG
jgi:hypothetical protein